MRQVSGVLVVLFTPLEPSQACALMIFCWASEGVISSAGLDSNYHLVWCKSIKPSAGRKTFNAFQPPNHQSGEKAFCYHPSKLLRVLEGLSCVLSHIYSELLCDKPQDWVGDLGKASLAVLEALSCLVPRWMLLLFVLQQHLDWNQVKKCAHKAPSGKKKKKLDLKSVSF